MDSRPHKELKECQMLKELELSVRDGELVLKSTVRAATDFERSVLWKDIQKILIHRIYGNRNKLETMGKGFQEQDYIYVQAETAVLREMLDILNVLKGAQTETGIANSNYLKELEDEEEN